MYPAPARPGLGWKLLQSWWVLISIFGFGCFSGAGILLVGLRARKPAWWGCGVGYLLIGTGMIVAFDSASNPTDSASGGGFALLWLVVWIACIVHSFVLNVYWLRWLEQRRAATAPLSGYPQQPAFGSPAAYGSPAGFGSPVGPASAMPYSGAPYQGQGHTASAGFPAQPSPQTQPQFPSTSTTPWPPATPWTPNAPAYGPVDVNTADATLLSTLDDFDGARIAYVLSERQRRGGFSSLAEFAATAQLSPHQFDRLQHRLTLSLPPRY